jgi:hypothetical protein
MSKILINIILTVILIAFSSIHNSAQTIDLSNATIINFEKDDKVVLKAVSVLQEEIAKRTEITIPVSSKLIKTSKPLIFVGLESQTERLPTEIQISFAALPSIKNEGYKIIVNPENKTVAIIGADARGALYGIGKLLRTLEMRNKQILVQADFKTASSPQYPIRGHQLGYRPKTNAYDAWTPAQMDSYIRDLAIFGANSIEIMPPRTDDDFTSVHMKLPAIKMIAEQSKICDSYGMDVWMWYPNMGTDYSHPDSIQKEIDERREVFKAVSRLDALFVPGGDPGDLEPDVLFSWLEKEAKILHEYHPNAKIWVSPQVFKPSKEWYGKFYKHVNKKYNWFGGIVYGPWIRTPLPEVKKLIDPSIPIRLYPDITHSISCQYPVPDWDIAYAMTLGRECINPRPEDEKYIHNLYAPLANGSISYSEGTNDDVNKFIWSSQDWDPSTPVIETLREYAHFFIGPDYADNVAQGLLALEQNLRGPLISNQQVQRTLQQWQDMEKTAPQNVLANPRFQSGLIRAYFDAYIQRRLINETGLERQARNILENAKNTMSYIAIRDAKNTLSLTIEKPVSVELKERCFALADSLFRSFGAQLTIEKHNAMGGRGNFIDNIDTPLNDAVWMMDQMNQIEKLGSEKERLAAIDEMLHRTDPGPGGFYDNFGSPAAWKRIKSKKSWKEDPGSLESPRVSFGVGLSGVDWVHEVVAKGFGGQTTPLAWMNQINTLYDTPLEMEYDDLDPSAEYVLKIAYTGRFRSNMKLMADGVVIHGFIRMGTKPLYEFELPKQITTDGKINFTWTCGDDDKGEGERGSQVAEIWLMKKR